MSRMLFLRDIDVDVLMRCRACGHEGTLPRMDLERRFGPGYPVLSLAPHFRCSKCHSRDVESRPVPTPDGPALETMVDKAATAEVEDRFQSTLAALRGLVDAAHEPDREPDREPDPGPYRDSPPPRRAESAIVRAEEPLPPLGSMMDALRGLSARPGDDDGDEDGPDADHGGPVTPPAAPAAVHDDDGDDFQKELERISRLMGEEGDGRSSLPPTDPDQPEDEDWLPALFRDDVDLSAPAVPSPSVPVSDDADDDALDLVDTAPEPDGPEHDEPEVVDEPPPAYLTDTMAALRSLIQSAAQKDGGGTPPEPAVPSPPARPDFGFRPDEDDEEAGLPDPTFGTPLRDPDPATDQDLSALRAMVEKAERDADRSTSAADIASVIPPDFRPPFWVETGLDQDASRAGPLPPSAPAPATPSPVAAPPAAAPVPPPATVEPVSEPEPPRRKGSFLDRLRRRRSDAHHAEDHPASQSPAQPVPPPEPSRTAATVVPAAPPPADDAASLDQRLAALKAMLAGQETPPPPPPPVAAKAGWDDDDILDLDEAAEIDAPPSPPSAEVGAEEGIDNDDFRRVLFNRLREERQHPSVHPSDEHREEDSPAEDDSPAEEDIPMEDILSFTIRDRAHGDAPSAETAARPPEPPPENEEDTEPEPADFGRFAIRDPDILFARSHPDEDEEEPAPSYLWDESPGPEPDLPPSPVPSPVPEQAPFKLDGKVLPASPAGPRPDAEAYERTLAALRGILGARGADDAGDDSVSRGGGRRRRKKSI